MTLFGGVCKSKTSTTTVYMKVYFPAPLSCIMMVTTSVDSTTVPRTSQSDLSQHILCHLHLQPRKFPRFSLCTGSAMKIS